MHSSVYNGDDCFHMDTLIERIMNSAVTPDKICLSVATSVYKSCFFYNADLDDMVVLDDLVREVYIINCNTKTSSQVLFWLDSHVNGSLEVAIYNDNDTDGQIIYSMVSNADSLHLYSANKKFALLTNNAFYSFNVTQNHLQFLHQLRTWRCCSVELSISEEVRNKSKPLVQQTKLEAVHFVTKEFRTFNALQLDILHRNQITLKRFEINNYSITDEYAGDVADIVSYSANLEEVYLNNNNLKAKSAFKIMKSLQGIAGLQKLCFRNNCVTDMVINLIVTILSQHVQLQVLDLSNNKLDAQNTLKILNALHNFRKLSKSV